jgi:hypothetical protein
MSTADYPRMLFHRRLEPAVVQSEEEEAALGAEWSRTIPQPDIEPAAPPPDLPDVPDPGEQPDPGQEPDEPETVRRPPGRPKKALAPAKRRA